MNAHVCREWWRKLGQMERRAVLSSLGLRPEFAMADDILTMVSTVRHKLMTFITVSQAPRKESQP